MKNSSNPLDLAFNQSATSLLAMAVVELFPGALWISGEGTPLYFFYDFILPFPFQQGLLPLIEERMRFIIKEKREIRSLEMTPFSAAERLRHQGQPLAAQWMAQLKKTTVTLHQIGDDILYSDGLRDEKAAFSFFKLIEGVSFVAALDGSERVLVRLIGAAGDKVAIRKRVKGKIYSSCFHLFLTEEAHLLTPRAGRESWVWMPRGEWIRQAIIRWWEGRVQKQQFSLMNLPLSAREGERDLIRAYKEYFLSFGEKKTAQMVLFLPQEEANLADTREGLLSVSMHWADRSFSFCADQNFLKECISSLHFILQIPKILGFEFELVLVVSLEAARSLRSQSVSVWEQALRAVGCCWTMEQAVGVPFLTCVEVRIRDVLGRKWTGPFVGVPLEPLSVGQGKMLVFSSLGSLERLLALLLERTSGWLPAFFAPEQVRLLALSSSARSGAQEVERRLVVKGIRVNCDERQVRLKDKVDLAVRDRVPYVALIGEQESVEEIRILQVQTKQERVVSLEKLCAEIREGAGE